MRTNTMWGGAAIAAVLVVAGCAATEDAPGGTHAAPATAPAPATTPTFTAPTTSPEGLPPRLPQPGETRVPETERHRVVRSDVPRPATTPATAPPRTPTATPAPTTPAARTPSPTRTTASPQTTTQRPTATAPETPRGNTITIGSWTHGYVSDYGSQASLDRCNLVEWERLWFAGHNYCGYQFWAGLGKGQRITLTGRDAGTYTVTATVYLPYQGGQKPPLPAHDLALQTCKGSGTQIVLAVRVG